MATHRLRLASSYRLIDGAKLPSCASLGLAMTTLSLLNIACGKTNQKVEPVQALSTQENVAALSRGARAIASSSAAARFAIANLNDGTPEAWGGAESQDDTYAAIVLPDPIAIREFTIWLFSPDQPPRPCLRDIRVVVADSEEAAGTKWRVIRSRLSTDQPFSEKVTVPPSEDGRIVRLEIDTSYANYGAHKIWGFACFTATKGDARNYLAPGTGTGIYVRELQMK